MIRITMMVHNMIFLLLNDLLDATWSRSRMAVDLTLYQDEDPRCDGEEPHDYPEARKAQAEQSDQPPKDEPYGQQEETYIMSNVHWYSFRN
jgi:hypothetical protein